MKEKQDRNKEPKSEIAHPNFGVSLFEISNETNEIAGGGLISLYQLPEEWDYDFAPSPFL
jgi:hypothetical protein